MPTIGNITPETRRCAKKFREFCKTHGISMGAMAEACGCSKTSGSGWGRGIRPHLPARAAINSLAKIVRWDVYPVIDVNQMTKSQREAYNAIHALPEYNAMRKRLIELANDKPLEASVPTTEQLPLDLEGSPMPANAPREQSGMPEVSDRAAPVSNIRAILELAEWVRTRHGVDYYIKEDGSLGARIVTTMEF